MTNKLFIGSLSYSATDLQLEEHFSKIGKVLSAKVITDRYSGQGKGFGFVEMSTEEEAKKAMKELNDTTLDGRNIVVKEAKPQEDRSNRRNDGPGSIRW
ncbi:RNA-binding protein [Candidatus Curtissbacteria bacterium RIFCSPLOWO2_01_FULL_38_11b]|uniref:RNA-binding protein n=1 Tax=Candidatus Curtissbacteria bacterium RIFCSPLOWO2_01_FULL_38_11b TaxID=1797725 RepID=A0A1F5H210_9BACT|nr:MAG: RNA-binding protein [Candidatus Curtissbacteria bacterium RIFCSPLOWO2_01_FULL_38_11b]